MPDILFVFLHITNMLRILQRASSDSECLLHFMKERGRKALYRHQIFTKACSIAPFSKSNMIFCPRIQGYLFTNDIKKCALKYSIRGKKKKTMKKSL